MADDQRGPADQAKAARPVTEDDLQRTLDVLLTVVDGRGEIAWDDPRLAAVAARQGWDEAELGRRIDGLMAGRWLELIKWTERRHGQSVSRGVTRVRIVDYRWRRKRRRRPARSGSIPRELRAAAWALTRGDCWYCGRETNPCVDFWVDHVVPVEAGGTTCSANLMPCCQTCNQRKGTKSLDEFRALLERETAGVPAFTAEQVAYLGRHGIELPKLERHWFYFEEIGAMVW